MITESPILHSQGRLQRSWLYLLVKKVVIHLYLRVGFEVIWHQHDRDLNMAQFIDLEKHKIDSTGYTILMRTTGLVTILGNTGILPTLCLPPWTLSASCSPHSSSSHPWSGWHGGTWGPDLKAICPSGTHPPPLSSSSLPDTQFRTPLTPFLGQLPLWKKCYLRKKILNPEVNICWINRYHLYTGAPEEWCWHHMVFSFS